MELIAELEDIGLDEEALDMIAAEDIRQIEKWGYQVHSIETWYLILAEEVGELAKAILEAKVQGGGLSIMEKEATQAATVAIKIARMIRSLGKELSK